MDDSRLGFITINEVMLSKDLASAKIYFTVLNTDELGKKEPHQVVKRTSSHDPTSMLAKKCACGISPNLNFFMTIHSIPGCGLRNCLGMRTKTALMNKTKTQIPMKNSHSRRNIHGIVLLDKRLGISSNRALQEVKRLFNANKAGHTGSLDPLATGLLPICFGEATKVFRDDAG